MADESKFTLSQRIPYLVIGGGSSGYTAAANIAKNDPNAKVLVVSSGKYLPYMRPILTKDIWTFDSIDYDKINDSSDLKFPPLILLNY